MAERADVRRDQLRNGRFGDALIAKLAVVAQLRLAFVRSGPRCAERVTQVREAGLAGIAVPGELEDAEALVAVIAAPERGEQLPEVVEVVGVVPIRHHLCDTGTVRRRGIAGGRGADPVRNRDIGVVRIGVVATGFVGVHAEGQPHISAAELRQRVVDHAEVELAVVGGVGGQGTRVDGLQLPPRDPQAGVIGRGPGSVPLLRGIALREKRIQPFLVLAAQRVGDLLSAGRNGRTDHRGQRSGIAVATASAEHHRRAHDSGQRALPRLHGCFSQHTPMHTEVAPYCLGYPVRVSDAGQVTNWRSAA